MTITIEDFEQVLSDLREERKGKVNSIYYGSPMSGIRVLSVPIGRGILVVGNDVLVQHLTHQDIIERFTTLSEFRGYFYKIVPAL